MSGRSTFIPISAASVMRLPFVIDGRIDVDPGVILGVVFYPEEICCTTFINIFLLFGIEIKLAGIT